MICVGYKNNLVDIFLILISLKGFIVLLFWIKIIFLFFYIFWLFLKLEVIGIIGNC